MFEVKGKNTDGQNVHIVVELAADFHGAVAAALEAGIVEIYACHLNTSLREVFRNPEAAESKWYQGSICEFYPSDKEGGKPKKATYNMLFEASSLDEANELFHAQLQQGYNSVGRGIKETAIDEVI